MIIKYDIFNDIIINHIVLKKFFIVIDKKCCVIHVGNLFKRTQIRNGIMIGFQKII